jgi:16S rRNA (guanine(966)-N(2))-methyltransferase RsmD
MTRKRNLASKQHASSPPAAEAGDADVRIIGGEFRGRRLRYHGDPIVRPMKHRVREAIFNLISTDVAGRQAFDLFAGTGAMGLEALSRGAIHATLIEKHVPTARIIEENIRTLGVQNRTTLLVTSAFLWAKRDLPSAIDNFAALDPQPSTLNPPWLVFCSPPYAFFVDRRAEMLDLITRLKQHAPAGSVVVVEADERFDFDILRAEARETPAATADDSPWRVRAYPPAVVGIWSKSF